MNISRPKYLFASILLASSSYAVANESAYSGYNDILDDGHDYSQENFVSEYNQHIESKPNFDRDDLYFDEDAEFASIAANTSVRANTSAAYTKNVYQNKHLAQQVSNRPEHQQVWKRLVDGYSPLVSLNNDSIDSEIKHLSSDPNLFARTQYFLHYAVAMAEKHNVPSELALIPVIESRFNPFAGSSKDAVGLWQFIPDTALEYGLKINADYDGRKDVVDSTNAAYIYLKFLFNRYESWEVALAAYNYGLGNIDNAIKYNQNVGLPTDFWSLDLPRETRNYVPRLLAAAKIAKEPEKYGVVLPAVANKSYFAIMPAEHGNDIHSLADDINVSINELRLLNAGLRSGVVTNKTSSTILIPAVHVIGFEDTETSVNNNPTLKSNQPTVVAANEMNAVINTARQQLRDAGATIKPVVFEQTNEIFNNEPKEVKKKLKNNFAYDARLSADPTQLADYAQAAYVPSAYDISLIINDGQSSAYSQNNAAQNVVYTSASGSASPKTYSSSKNTKPQTQQKKKPVKRAVPSVYKVRPGDTLIGIAKKYNLPLSYVAERNNLKTYSRLNVNQRLYLTGKAPKKPTKKTTAAKQTPVKKVVVKKQIAKRSAVNTSPQKVVQTPQGKSAATKNTIGKSKIHVVRSGDSITNIAQRYNVRHSYIAKLNGIPTNAKLRVGMQVKVSGVISEANKRTKYIVRRNDTLRSVAGRYGLSVASLAKANNMSTNASLAVGKVIYLF